MSEMTVQHILVAIDFGSASRSALEYGAGLAGNLGATLHVVHVTDADHADSSHERARLEAFLTSLATVTTRVVILKSARPAAALIAYARAEQIDLIVAGTGGRERSRDILDFFMGSVAQNLVRNAPCPVMTMRAPVVAAA